MEKIINLNGKEIGLKASAMNLLIHQQEFGIDMFQDQNSIISAVSSNYTIDIGKLNGLAVCRLLWTFARTYDRKFPSFTKWMEEMEEIPILEIFNDVYELFLTNMHQRTDIVKNSVGTEDETEERKPSNS